MRSKARRPTPSEEAADVVVVPSSSSPFAVVVGLLLLLVVSPTTASYATPPTTRIDPLAARSATRPLLAVRSSPSSSSPRVVVRPPRSDAEEEKESSAWSDFKDVTYNIADATAALLKRSKEGTVVPKQRRPTAAGYGESAAIENSPPYPAVAETTTKGPETPGEKLLRRYEASKPGEESEQRRSPLAAAAVIPNIEPRGGERQRGRQIATTREAADDGDYFRSDPRKAFDSVKDGLYGAFDSIVDLFSSSDDGGDRKTTGRRAVARSPARNLTGEARRSPSTTTALDRSSSTSTSIIPPVARPSANDDVESRAYKRLLPKLSSENPITRFRAEMELRSIEKRRKVRETRRKRQETLEDVKETIYGIADKAGSVIEYVSNVPGMARDAATGTVEVAGNAFEIVASVPGAIGSTISTTVETARSVPARARETVEGVKTGVDNTIRTAEKVVDNVKSVPSNVQQTVAETKRKLDAVGSTVEDVTYNAKVLVGAEEPKPPPPPPKPTAEEVVKKWAWRGTTGAARAAWFLGKNAVVWGGKGLMAGWDLAMTPKETASVDERRGGAAREEASQRARLEGKMDVRAGTAKKSDDLPEPNLVATIDDVDADLGKEVSDALRLAKEALAMPAAADTAAADGINAADANGKAALARTERDIDEALRKARTAALAAANDVMEVEELLKKKMDA